VGGTPVAVDTARPSATVVGPAGPRLQLNLPSAIASPTAAGLLVPATTDGPVLPLLAPASGVVVTVDARLTPMTAGGHLPDRNQDLPVLPQIARFLTWATRVKGAPGQRRDDQHPHDRTAS